MVVALFVWSSDSQDAILLAILSASISFARCGSLSSISLMMSNDLRQYCGVDRLGTYFATSLCTGVYAELVQLAVHEDRGGS
jgi:hypothetical protein